MVGEGIATTNMELLYNLADKTGIPRPEQEVEKESLETSMAEEGVEIKTRIAFLPREEIIMVYMSECMSPSHFYLHKVAHTDSLDITDWAKKENIPNYNFRPKEGELVVVEPEGEMYFCRARVIRVAVVGE